MSYDLFTHKHNFAVWAAARAAQRGLKNGSVLNLQTALENSGIKEFFQKTDANQIDCKKFDALHQKWCLNILTSLKRTDVHGATFGRAAKLIAIYLKVMVILNDAIAYSPFGKCIHPPIDSRLLKSMAKNHKASQKENRALWKSTNWTDLDEKNYYELIKTLRSSLAAGEPFWILERYWTAA